MTYLLWHTVSANVLAEFDNENEALAELRNYVDMNPGHSEEFVIVVMDDETLSAFAGAA